MTEPEFHRPVVIDHVDEAQEIAVEATETERAALAARFDLVALDKLTATVALTPSADGAIVRLDGHLAAEVTQTCVVTLEPVRNTVDERFAMAFTADQRRAAPENGEAGDEEIVLGMEEDDPPELVADGIIDIGEVVAEHLSLALDPFPRAPGAEIDYAALGAEPPPAGGRENPFAKLAELKGRMKN